MGERLGALVADLGRIVAELDTDRVTGEQAAALTALFARGERLCQVGKALGARRAAICGAWRRSGDRSPEEWLSRLAGSATSPARGVLDVAARVEAHPELSRAWRSGQLSPTQAAEIARAVEADPQAATRLVEQAREGTWRAVRDACRAVGSTARSAEEDRARYRAIHAGRYLRGWRDRDGAGRLDARLTPDAYAAVLACLRPFQEQAFHAARAAGQRGRHETYAADALVAMARASTGRGDRDGGPAAAVTVVVDHAALVRGSVESGERCELEGIGPVPLATARAMMSDAFLAAVVTDGVDIRAVAHLGRRPTAAQRTALRLRDRACVVPGCGETHRLEIDHVDGWAATRVTTLDRLARLCHHHHHLKTYEGWTLTGTPGTWQWNPPRRPTLADGGATGPTPLPGADGPGSVRPATGPVAARAGGPSPPQAQPPPALFAV